MNRSVIPFLCLVVASTIATGNAVADDLHVPPWWESPASLVAYWNEGTPGQGDLVSLGLDIGDPTTPYPLTSENFGSGAGQPHLSIVPGPDGFDYQFFMPDYIDELPLKNMRIQVTFSGILPTISGIAGTDPSGPVTTIGPKNHVPDVPSNPFAQGYYYEDWDLRPNPDWEVVHIQVPTASRLHQVVIDSISLVPEPATTALVGWGVLALGFGARRRRSLG